jgi:hypothetical protein
VSSLVEVFLGFSREGELRDHVHAIPRKGSSGVFFSGHFWVGSLD